MTSKAKECLRNWADREKQTIGRRFESAKGGQRPPTRGPELTTQTIQYEASNRVRAIPYGGIGAIHRLAHKVGLVKSIDSRLHILERHRPYSESDHILNIAYNLLCGGNALDDIEIRRNDSAFLNALGARTIPDPTTAGDFCRRFDDVKINQLMDIINDVRVGVWQKQPHEFLEQTARIDADGTMVETNAECKQGMDVAYNGKWGYHPLLISLANTGEPLFVLNRSGNRPSEEGAPAYFDRAIALCRRAGFKNIILRGDTAFAMTKHFDRWDDEGIRFIFGYDAFKTLTQRAAAIDDEDYDELIRDAKVSLLERAKMPRVKEQIVRDREFRNLRLEREDFAEFEYRPKAASRAYRVVVVAKTIVEEKGQMKLGYCDRYFFYITNDRALPADEIIREANDRCNQENLIAQLKTGRILSAPVHTLISNWTYMVIASLAWSLKSWFALLAPIAPGHRAHHVSDRERLLRMDLRTFIQRLILVPTQILETGHRLIYRFLAWRPDLPILFRLLDAL